MDFDPKRLVSLQEEEIWTCRDSKGVHTEERPVRPQREGGHWQTKEEAAEETKPAGTLILNF